MRAHHYTEGSVVAPSELELIDGRWPLETATCVTPPNCLRLSWRSGRGADWRMTLRLTRYYANIKPAGSHAVVLGLRRRAAHRTTRRR